MPQYASLVDVRNQDFQNIQELSSLWGEIRNEIQRFDVSIEESYAVLGEHDFIVIMTAPDRDSVFQAALAIEGYGLEAQTMEIAPTEDFAELVEDTG